MPEIPAPTMIASYGPLRAAAIAGACGRVSDVADMARPPVSPASGADSAHVAKPSTPFQANSPARGMSHTPQERRSKPNAFLQLVEVRSLPHGRRGPTGSGRVGYP